MIDACLADAGDLDDDCSSDSEFGGVAAAPSSMHPIGAASSGSESSSSVSAAPAKMVEHSSLLHGDAKGLPGCTSADPLRNAAASSGIYDDITAAEQEAIRANNAIGAADSEDGRAPVESGSAGGGTREGETLPPGWQLADCCKRSAQAAWGRRTHGVVTSQQELASCREEDGRLKADGRRSGVATALFWLCFRDAATERRYCSTRHRLLRPVRLKSVASTFADWRHGLFLY